MITEKTFYAGRNTTKRLYFSKQWNSGKQLSPTPKFYQSRTSLIYGIKNSRYKDDDWSIIEYLARQVNIEKLKKL